jgi:hypothetical protein
MDALWDAARQEGVPEEDIKLLRTLCWKKYGITNELGNVLRKILIKLTGRTALQIENEYAPCTVTSFATGTRKGLDDDGDGPGLVWNFLFCLAMHRARKIVPMTGAIVEQGDFYATYIKCVDKKIAETMGIPVATHMVVFLSRAFIRSAMCMVEVYTAIQSGIELVLVNIEEPIDWAVAWPKEKTLASYPFTGGKLKWGAAAFAINRQTVLDKLTGNNSYPRPNIFAGMDTDPANGNIAKAWSKNDGWDVLSCIVEQAGETGADASIVTGPQSGPTVQSTSGMESPAVLEDVKLRKNVGVIRTGVLHKLHSKRQQRRLRNFELVRTTDGSVEMRCVEGPKKKGRASTAAGGEQHPTAVWQLNWTSTEALAVASARGDQKKKKSTRKSSAARTKAAQGQGWSFSVAGLLNSKSLKQEQLLLEASAQDDAARWRNTINETMQESMAREFGRKIICGLKVLRIHVEGASMEVSAV